MKKILLFLFLIPTQIISQETFGYRLFLQNPEGNKFQTAILFDTLATDGADICCDAIWPFGNGYLDFHTKNNGVPYIINYYSIPTSPKTIPMYAIANPDTGLFTIGIDEYYGNSNSIYYLSDSLGNYSLPHQVLGPVTGQRFTFHVGAPVIINVTNGCELNQGGSAIINNQNPWNSFEIYRDGVLLELSNEDTSLSNLITGNYQYVWYNDIGQNTVDFYINNTLINATLTLPYDNLPIYDSGIIPEINITTSYDDIIWDFGDGSPFLFNDYNPVHIYTQPGIYNLKVKVTLDGCEITIERVITIYDIIGIETISPSTIKNKNYPYYYGIDGRLFKK